MINCVFLLILTDKLMKRLTLIMAAMLLMVAGCKKEGPIKAEIKIDGKAEIMLTDGATNGTFSFTSNYDWTITPKDSWVKVSPGSGKASESPITVTFTCDPNPDVTNRTTTVTISAEGVTKTIKITQPAKESIPVADISVEPAEATLTVGETLRLTATVLPADATDKTVSWSTSDAAVTTVDNGTVTAVAPGSATITATANGKTASCAVTVKATGPQIVDLGLSVLWADRNVGAESPEEYGDYYAWGETETKDTYSFSNCKWFGYGTENLTKYITHEKNGVVDNNLHMDSEDDVAYISLGEKWRTPTEAEFKELLDRCSWEWIGDSENKGGYKVTGPNGNSIYLPSAGGKGLTDPGYTGFYWASDIVVSVPNNSTQLIIDPGSAKLTTLVRFFGCSVRPVCGDIVKVSGLSLDKNGETINQGGTLQLTATLSPGSAFEKGILWSSSDESVATVGNNYDNYGVVTAVGEGTATITATTVDGGFKATCTVTVIKSFEFAAVDLGLSVKWANANLGASVPEDAGNYFAWGGTTTQDSYTWSTCPFVVSGTGWDSVKYSKYDGSPTTLEPMDDAASVNLGGKWRMPTEEEFNELISSDNSTIENITVNGINGVQITSKKTGSSIFLPAVGVYESSETPLYFNDSGFYWSSCLVRGYHSSFAKSFSFVGNFWEVSDRGRYGGMPIRPVWDETPPKTTIYLYDGNGWGDMYLYLWQGYDNALFEWPGLHHEGTSVINNNTFFKFSFKTTFDENMRMGMTASKSDILTYDQYCNDMKVGGTYYFNVTGNYIVQIDPLTFQP